MKDIEKYKEIFNSPLVEAIERELIWTGHDCERVGGEQYKEAVRSLLRIRKQVLDDLFAPTAEHKILIKPQKLPSSKHARKPSIPIVHYAKLIAKAI